MNLLRSILRAHTKAWVTYTGFTESHFSTAPIRSVSNLAAALYNISLYTYVWMLLVVKQAGPVRENMVFNSLFQALAEKKIIQSESSVFNDP